MAAFPKVENDILSLANSIAAGLTEHPDDFPAIDPALLQQAIADFKTAREQQAQAKALALLATEKKKQAMSELKKTMRTAIKKAEAITADDPDKLYEIGWAPKPAPSEPAAASMPIDLETIAQGTGELWLAWKKPAETTGMIRNYIIEKRQADQGSFGDWQLEATTIDKKIHLTGQPKGIQLEYRVKAVNTAGTSTPSNTAAVVL